MNKNLRKYSQALYNVSTKDQSSASIKDELNSIMKMYKKIAAFRFVIITKSMTSEKKCNILKKTLHNFNPLIVEFISLIILEGYSKKLIDIIKHYNQLVNSNIKMNTIDLIVSEGLDKSYINELSNSLSDILKTNQKINVIQKPQIIGGIKLKIGNKVFDNSISSQLNKLKKTLYNM